MIEKKRVIITLFFVDLLLKTVLSDNEKYFNIRLPIKNILAKDVRDNDLLIFITTNIKLTAVFSYSLCLQLGENLWIHKNRRHPLWLFP